MTNIPTMIRKMLTTNRNTYLLLNASVIQLANVCGICSRVSIHEKHEAAATISIIELVVVTVSLQPFAKSVMLISRYITPSMSAYTMATVPASLAVNTPIRTPPMMMIGRSSGRTAGRIAAHFSLTDSFVVRIAE